jgi:multiple sugar transport system substrate-binding protein
MCYHWSNRYGVLDSHALLQQGGRVGLQLHPTYASDMVPVSPLGGALLAIPASNPEPAARWAWRVIETLTSSELAKYFVLHGAAGSARQSVAEDRYVKQRNRVIAVIDRLAGDRQIQTIPSPALANYRDMTQTLSDYLELLLFDGVQDIRKGLGALQRALANGSRRERSGATRVWIRIDRRSVLVKPARRVGTLSRMLQAIVNMLDKSSVTASNCA